jgi:hypothetical protein
MTLIEKLDYFHALWTRLFSDRPLDDDQIITWLESFGAAELELVWTKAARKFRTEHIETIPLYRYISGTLNNRRNDALKHMSTGASR